MDARKWRQGADGGHLAVAVLILLIVLSWLPQFLSINPGVSYGDEGIVAQAAKRVVAGQLPFRDFSTMFPPGTAWWYGMFMFVFGVDFFALRLGVLVTAFLVILLAFWGYNRLVPRRPFGAFVLLSFLAFFGGPYWFIASHHWLSLVFCLLSLVLLIPARGGEHPCRVSLLFSGIAAAGVVMILQHKGGLWLVAVTVVLTMNPWQQARQLLLWFWGGVLVLAVPVLAYFLVKVGWTPLVEQLIMEPLFGYHKVVGHQGGTILKDLLLYWQNASSALPSDEAGFVGWLSYFTWNLGFLGRFLVHFLPLAGLIGLVWLWHVRLLPRFSLLLLTIFWVVNYLATLHRFHETTLVFAAPAAVLILAVVVGKVDRQLNGFLGKALPVLWIALFLTIATGFALLESLPGKSSVELPGGIVYSLYKAETEELAQADAFLRTYRQPGDQVLCISYVPMLYFLLDLENPIPYEVVSPVSEDSVFAEVQDVLDRQRVRWIIRDNVGFAGLTFGRYLSKNYQAKARIGRLILYERVPEPQS